MADWSVVAAAAVTGVTGVVSGSLGYLLAHQQTRAQERQAVAARREAQQEKRGETYHNFLDVDRQLPAQLSAGLEISRKELEDWLQPFNHCYNAVILLGSDEVALRARDLFDGYLGLYDAMTGGGRSWPDLAERQEIWAEQRGRLDEARKSLIEAMRRDVSGNGDRRPARAGARPAIET
jgi:hypothetical protein